MITDKCDKACRILQNTNDGEDLAPKHLYLVQCVVNGEVTEYGEQTFEKLHDDCVGGEYVKPWHCGIEHLTKDHNGYIYWKGISVEHYSFNNFDDEKVAALDLADRCRHLESIGVEVNGRNVIWSWEDFKDIEP